MVCKHTVSPLRVTSVTGVPEAELLPLMEAKPQAEE